MNELTIRQVGLLPDEPLSTSASQLSSVLAHNFIWLADTAFLDTLFARIKEHLPQTVPGAAGEVKGINGRFRLYRYREGALYRPHVRHMSPSFSCLTSNLRLDRRCMASLSVIHHLPSDIHIRFRSNSLLSPYTFNLP